MRRALPLLALAVALALVLPATLAPAATASPQPTPVCALCGPGLSNAADDYARERDLPDPNVTVTHSRATVQIHENGTATWRVRNDLANGTAWLRSGNRLERVAASYEGRAYGYPEQPAAVTARFVDGGDAVVLTARDPGFAERRAGVLVVDAFHDRGSRPWYWVNADRFVVRGPPGTVVANDPPDVAVDGGAATWRGGVDALYDADSTVEGSPYLVFGPDDSAVTQLRTHAALALATLPIVLDSLGSYVLWQTAGFGLVLAGAVAGLRAWDPRPRVSSLAGGVAAVAVAVLVAQGVAWGVTWAVPTTLVAVVLAGFAWHDGTREGLRDARGQALAALAGLAVVFAAVALLGLLVETSWDALPGATRATTLALPLAALVPLGGASTRDRRTTLRWGVLAVAGFALLAVAVVNPVDPPTGLGGGLAALFLAALAVALPVLGAPLVVLGRTLADRDAASPASLDDLAG